MSVEQHVALQRLWERSWFMGGNEPVKCQPPFGSLQLLSLLACRKQESKAVPTQSLCWSWAPGAIVLFAALDYTRGSSAQSKGIPVLIHRNYWPDVPPAAGAQLQGQLSLSTAYCSQGEKSSCSHSCPSPGIQPAFCGVSSPSLIPLREKCGWGMLRKPWG